MNKNRREQLKTVIAELNHCSENLNFIKDEEDETRENIPESFQSSDSYCFSEECSDKIDDAVTEIQGVINSLENII